MTTPPGIGQYNWGDTLDEYMAGIQNVANEAEATVSEHVANNPPDPHGDRAFAQSLVTPITSGVNQPNGYVTLNSVGKINQNLISGAGGSGGSFTDIFDVVAGYGATGNGSTDDSGAIQSALNACMAAGGGEVWVPSGKFAISSTLIVGANTWVHLSPGATIARTTGASTPQWLISNIAIPSGSTPASGNIVISGGTWDAYNNGLTGACTPIFLMQANFCSIQECKIVSPPNNPAVELNGCTNINIDEVVGTGPSSSGPRVPMIRINSSATTTTPAGLSSGLYNNTVCSYITMSASGIAKTLNPPFANFAGTDLSVAGEIHSNLRIHNCFGPHIAGTPVSPINWGNYALENNQFTDVTGTGIYTDGNLSLFTGGLSGAGLTITPTSIITSLPVVAKNPSSAGADSWHPIPLTTNWTAGNDFNGKLYVPSYTLLPNGDVALRGVLIAPNSGFSEAWGNLPVGYRPINNSCYFTTTNATGNQPGNIVLGPGGNLFLNSGNWGNTYTIILDGTFHTQGT